MRTVITALAFAFIAFILIATAAHAHGTKGRVCHSHSGVTQHCH